MFGPLDRCRARDCRPATASATIAADVTRHRRCRAAQPCGDHGERLPCPQPARDLFTLLRPQTKRRRRRRALPASGLQERRHRRVGTPTALRDLVRVVPSARNRQTSSRSTSSRCLYPIVAFPSVGPSPPHPTPMCVDPLRPPDRQTRNSLIAQSRRCLVTSAEQHNLAAFDLTRHATRNHRIACVPTMKPTPQAAHVLRIV